MRPSRKSPIGSPEIIGVSDDFWAAVEPLIPVKARTEDRDYQRQPGAGRKPIPARKAFEGVVHVLRTGVPWKALPKSLGSASTIHRHFDTWQASGFFVKLWEAGLAEHEEMEGIAWQWQRTTESLPHRNGHGRHALKRSGSALYTAAAAGIAHREWQPSLLARRRRRRPAQG